MIVWLTNITFASNVIGDVPSSSNENRTLNRETTIYNWTCDITQDLAFYSWSPVYLRVGQPKWPVSYVFDKTETYVRGYNQSTFVGNIKFPYVSNFVPSTTIDSDSSNILTVDATGATLLWSANTTRNQAAGQFVTFNNERSIVQNANGVLLNYYYIRANDLSLHNGTLNVIINPSITKKISCTNYYVARCGDGVIDKQTGTSDGNWWITTQWWIFLLWHGNSIKPNEVCDDWAQNGQAGKCKTDCTGIWSGTETGSLVVDKILVNSQLHTPWDTVEFRINISNPSTQTVQNIAIEDYFLPSGFEYISSEIVWVTWPTYFKTGSNASWNFVVLYTWFSLSAGQNGYIRITAKFNSCNDGRNHAFWSAISNWTPLNWYTNEQVLCSVGGEVTISKTATPSSVQLWQTVGFTIRVNNGTTSTITNVRVQDMWPDCFSFVTGSSQSTPSVTPNSNGTLTDWPLWWLPANQTFIINFSGQASTNPSCAGKTYSNTGKIYYTDAGGDKQIPTSASVSIVQSMAWIDIEKKVTTFGYGPGDEVEYSITYRNLWSTAVGPFIIKDFWPDSLRFLNSDPAPRNINERPVLVWEISGLQGFEEKTITIKWTIK